MMESELSQDRCSADAVADGHEDEVVVAADTEHTP